ncbi:MAG: peptidase C39 family protein [Nanoarchaeota archaeon]|nr:peptidase C39 family protein [Nanoarchaeota archaeon]
MQQYKQTTIYTCAAASLMSIINHFKPEFALSRENEFLIWERSAVLPTRGSSLYALALFAHKQSIPVKIFVEEPEYKFPGYRFKSYKKKEIDVADFHSELYYKRAKEARIPIEERNFNIDEVKTLLKRKKVLLLRVIIGLLRGTQVNKRNPHYIPVYQYEDGFFYIIDPRRGMIKIQEELFKEAFDAVHDCKRDNRMIVFG